MVDTSPLHHLSDGTRVRLHDAGEGWFAGVGDITGEVRGTAGRQGEPRSWYVLHLDEPLEIQETGHHTVSGFRMVRYSRLLVRSRVAGEEINAKTLCPVHLCLVPEGIDAAHHLASVRHPTAWANCIIVEVC